MNPRRTLQHVRDFQSRSLGHSDTSPGCAGSLAPQGPATDLAAQAPGIEDDVERALHTRERRCFGILTTRARGSPRTSRRLRGLIYPETQAVDSILVSPRVGRIGYEEARSLPYREAAFGEQLGPQWSTFWFDVSATVPEAWAGERVDLQWVTHSEATLWIDGRSIQGLNSGASDARTDAVLTAAAQGGERLRFQVEIACNGSFGSLEGGRRYATIEPVVLDRCELARFDADAWRLFHDFDVLRQLEAEHAVGSRPCARGALARGAEPVLQPLVGRRPRHVERRSSAC